MKEYHVTSHAIERAVERLGQTRSHARNHLVTLMQTAVYQGEQPNARGVMTKIYDHHRSRTRLVVDGTRIVTAYKMEGPLDAESFPKEIRAAIQRKASALTRQYRKEIRSIETELAEVNLEIARLQLNRARARSPKVRAAIDVKLTRLRETYESIERKQTAAGRKLAEVAAHV
ncbi:hypothetical protein [Alteribacter populi]|uniref:hypothetical protein n=1 Tax=Alteribacter populi TaxID=2011011 RepID=UPI000BBB54B9|nr:hypothetical protein [Alteribacter populi]